MTVRLDKGVGMKKDSEYAKKRDVKDHLAKLLSMSVGAGETKVIYMAQAYSMMVNGGKQITP